MCIRVPQRAVETQTARQPRVPHSVGLGPQVATVTAGIPWGLTVLDTCSALRSNVWPPPEQLVTLMSLINSPATGSCGMHGGWRPLPHCVLTEALASLPVAWSNMALIWNHLLWTAG